MSSHVSVHETMRYEQQMLRPRRGLSWAFGWVIDLAMLSVGMLYAVVSPWFARREE